MLSSEKNPLNHPRLKQFIDVRNIGLYIFSIIVLAITWSGVKTVQSNYELQKKIFALRQQNQVLELKNQNTALQNKYLQTDQYLELAARQDFGLAALGEKVLLIPKNVALKHVDQSVGSINKTSSSSASNDNRSRYIKNLEDWRDFLVGRKLFDN